MTSTSTLLGAVSSTRGGGMACGAVSVHFLLGGTHLALQNFLETGYSFQCLAGVVQHSLGTRAGLEAVNRRQVEQCQRLGGV